MGLSIVIVNYNTKGILVKCLKNLEEVTPEAQVIVVDSGSNDGSVEAVTSQFPKTICVASKTNVGLAAGINLGIAKAQGDYVLLLGTDAYPNKETLPYLINFMNKNPRVGVTTCQLLLRDGLIDQDAHRGFPTPWVAISHFLGLGKLFTRSKIFNSYFLGFKDFSQTQEIDLCISHFMLVKKQTLLEVGPMDEGFFVYGEDVDFCYRVKEKGWKIFYIPEVSALHYKGASVGVRPETFDITKASRDTKIKMAESSTGAMKRFYQKHLAAKYPKIILALVFLLIKLKKTTRSWKYSQLTTSS
jgi:GT2 family glycosyltransferase